MKAIVQDEYGAPERVLRLEDVEAPEVGEKEVLVRARATTVAGADWHLTRGLPYVARLESGLRRPKRRIPGGSVAGVVEEVGPGAERFGPGEEVFGWCEAAFAEYVAVAEDALAPKPENLSLEQAAAVPDSAFTALQALRDKGRLLPGQRTLIIGASGGVGTFAVQIGKAMGAEVTGVCSAANVELVRSLGADRVIDYAREDFTADDRRYELIIDLAGNRSLADLRRVLTERGTLVMVGGAAASGRWLRGTGRWFTGIALSLLVRQRLRPFVYSYSQEDLMTLKELIEAGKLTPVLGARYPLAEVAAAIGSFESDRPQGKVVITV